MQVDENHPSEIDENLATENGNEEVTENEEQASSENEEALEEVPHDESNSDANENETEGQEPEPVEEQKPRKKNSASDRIRQLNSEKKAALERAERLEKRLTELETPVDDDFDEYDINSVVERSSRQTAAIMQKQQVAEAKEEAARIEHETNAARLNGFQEAEQTFMEKVPDYEQVTGQLTEIAQNPTVAGLILDSDKGPEVAYYLGKNPNEAREFAQMSPLEAAKRIGGIEARLTAPAPKTATTAPKPVPKISGKNGSQSKDPSNMSMEEYEKWRQG